MYQECTDIEHPGGEDYLGLYCATAVDPQDKEMKSWGKCSRTCGYCSGSVVNKNSRWVTSNKGCNQHEEGKHF